MRAGCQRADASAAAEVTFGAALLLLATAERLLFIELCRLTSWAPVLGASFGTTDIGVVWIMAVVTSIVFGCESREEERRRCLSLLPFVEIDGWRTNDEVGAADGSTSVVELQLAAVGVDVDE